MNPRLYEGRDRSYRAEIEIRNREEIPFSIRIVPRDLLVAEEQKTALHNAAHLYSDQTNPLRGPAETHVWKPGVVTTRLRWIP